MKINNKTKRKGKRTARVLCRDGREFWTTQVNFWNWVRDYVVIKTQDNPLTGIFRHEDHETMIMCRHTVLNLRAPNHLQEVLLSRRKTKNLN